MILLLTLTLASVLAPATPTTAARGARIPVDLEISPEVWASIPPERRAVVEAIRDDVRRSVWRWDVGSFEYELPTTDFGEAEFVPSDLFRTPDAGELPIITRTPAGERIPLGEEHLETIRARAMIIVPSRAYPGKTHEWKIRPFFQTGLEKITLTFTQNKAFAYDQILIQIPARLRPGAPFNVYDGVSNLLAGLDGTMRAVVGVAETVNVVSDAEIKTRLREAAREQVTALGPAAVDPILDDPAHADAIDRELRAITTRFERTWPREREELLLRRLPELRAAGLVHEALADAARAWLAEQRTELIHRKILENSTLAKIAPDLGQRLVDRSRATQMAADAFAGFDAEIEAHRRARIADFKEHLPVRGLVPGEAARATHDEVGAFSRARWHDGVPRLVAQLDQAGLARDARRLETTFAFYLDQADDLARRWAFEKKPAREAKVRRKLWNSAEWTITKSERGGGYDVIDHEERRITSHAVGWRAELAAVRVLNATRAHFDRMWTGLILNGTCGWRATFADEEFCAFERVDRATGRIEPDPRSRRATPRSTQRGIKKTIADLKDAFEREPEGDVLSKDVVRPFVFTPYNIFYGLLTAGNFGGRGLGFLTTMIGGGLGIVAAVPVGLGVGLGRWLITDTFVRDSARGPNGEYPVSPLGLHLGLQTIGGAAVTVGAVLAVPVHAAVGSLGYALGAARYGLHRGWDRTMLSALKHAMYVPMHDRGVVAQRVKGPGLEQNYEFKIEPRLALAQLRARLEEDRLRAVTARVSHEIFAPVRAAEASVNEVYRAVHLRAEEAPWLAIVNEASTKIAHRLQRDERALREKLPRVERGGHRVRLAEADVTPTLDAAEAMTRDFWSGHEDEFDWTGVGLAVGDHRGLAELLLLKIFGKDLLTPLEPGDDAQVYEQPTPEYGPAIDAALDGRPVRPGAVTGDVDRDLIRRTLGDVDPRHPDDARRARGEDCAELLLRWTGR